MLLSVSNEINGIVVVVKKSEQRYSNKWENTWYSYVFQLQSSIIKSSQQWFLKRLKTNCFALKYTFGILEDVCSDLAKIIYLFLFNCIDFLWPVQSSIHNYLYWKNSFANKLKNVGKAC